MRADLSPEFFNRLGTGHLPGHLGVSITRLGDGSLEAQLAVKPELMAPNGYLHAGTVVSLADTACGYGCVASLPEGATGFTTIELKANFLGTARQGQLRCEARAVHRGRTTQMWDAEVFASERAAPIALFRCTQLLLYPRA